MSHMRRSTRNDNKHHPSSAALTQLTRTDHGTPREIHPLAREVPSEATLLALEALAQAAHGLAAHQGARDARALAVDEQGHLKSSEGTQEVMYAQCGGQNEGTGDENV